MDGWHFDTLTRRLSTPGTRRTALGGMLAGAAIRIAGLADSGAKGKNKKVTLCFNGSTIDVKKSRKGPFLRQGATPGECTSPPPPPPPSPPPPPPPPDPNCPDGVTEHCQRCEVCATGCRFSSVQAAIDATSPRLTTIRVCPGTYVEDANQFWAVDIRRSLTLIGAGDGADPATSTILRPTRASQEVVRIGNGNSVRLEGLRMTGANGDVGDGMGIAFSTVTLANCTITGNTATSNPIGGLNIYQAQVSLINTRVTQNSAPGVGGVVVDRGTLTLDAASRITNNTTGSQFGTGGLRIDNATVTLPSLDNVTGNSPINCAGNGTSSGPGAACFGN